jgi:hypothetical protein
MTVQGNWFTSNAIRPFVKLNGYTVESRYGVNVHPVPPGRWHIDVHCSWLREYGQAEYDVDVADGQTVDVFYGPPWHQFARGRIGPTEQKRPGFVGFLAMMAFAVVVVTVAIILTFL